MRLVRVLPRVRVRRCVCLGIGLRLRRRLLLVARVLVERVVAVHLRAELHEDRRERVDLDEPRHAQLGHLQQREKRDHEVEPRRRIREELLELHPPPRTEHVDQLVDAVGERDALVHDVVRELDLALGKDALERLDEREEGHVGERSDPGVHRLFEGAAAEEDVATHDAARLEIGACLLVLLVLEQAADERLARVLFILGERVVLLTGRRRRQEHLRLDVRQRGRHHEVFAREVEIHQLHDSEVLEVLFGHEPDGDLEDVELVLLTEVQEQIERSLEGRERDGIRVPGAARSRCSALWTAFAPARLLIPGFGFRHDRPRLEEPRRGFKGQRPCPRNGGQSRFPLRSRSPPRRGTLRRRNKRSAAASPRSQRRYTRQPVVHVPADHRREMETWSFALA